MQIEVLSVSQPAYTKTANGGYNKIEVAYKGDDGKVTGKQLVSFGAGQSVYDYFTTKVKQGDKLEITTEKSGKYTNWTAVAPASAGQSTAAQEQKSTGETGSTGSGRGRVTGSNYETPEERARRQVYIVRQSSITAAIATLARDGTKELDPAKVIEIAQVYEAYVFGKEQSNAISEVYKGEPVPVG